MMELMKVYYIPVKNCTEYRQIALFAESKEHAILRVVELGYEVEDKDFEQELEKLLK